MKWLSQMEYKPANGTKDEFHTIISATFLGVLACVALLRSRQSILIELRSDSDWVIPEDVFSSGDAILVDLLLWHGSLSCCIIPAFVDLQLADEAIFRTMF